MHTKRMEQIKCNGPMHLAYSGVEVKQWSNLCLWISTSSAYAPIRGKRISLPSCRVAVAPSSSQSSNATYDTCWSRKGKEFYFVVVNNF